MYNCPCLYIPPITLHLIIQFHYVPLTRSQIAGTREAHKTIKPTQTDRRTDRQIRQTQNEIRSAAALSTVHTHTRTCTHSKYVNDAEPN